MTCRSTINGRTFLGLETPLPCWFMQGRKEVREWVERKFSSGGQAGGDELNFNAGIEGKG